jgi:gluconate 2-dehydrogenase gamma chain
MDRREALRRTAWLMGGALSAPAIAGVLNGCTAKPTIDWKPEFLNSEQAATVTSIADIIIPATDTPGAKAVGVPAFIDKMLKDCYAPQDQQRFLDGLKAFNERAEKDFGDPFVELDPDDQTSLVEAAHKDAVEKYVASRYARPAVLKPFLLMLKELTLLGFFTSEPGATKVLQYEAVPGSYKGCVPLSEAGNGKRWATT